MTLYGVALFVHVVGALLLFATLTLEGIGLWSLRRATSAEQARHGRSVAGLTRVVGPGSALAILVPGLYMTATRWGWVTWIVTGIRLTVVARAATVSDRGDARLPLRHPQFVASWLTRVALALGIVFLMTDKPNLEGALLTLALAAALGVGASVLAWPRRGAHEVAHHLVHQGSLEDE